MSEAHWQLKIRCTRKEYKILFLQGQTTYTSAGEKSEGPFYTLQRLGHSCDLKIEHVLEGQVLVIVNRPPRVQFATAHTLMVIVVIEKLETRFWHPPEITLDL